MACNLDIFFNFFYFLHWCVLRNSQIFYFFFPPNLQKKKKKKYLFYVGSHFNVLFLHLFLSGTSVVSFLNKIMKSMQTWKRILDGIPRQRLLKVMTQWLLCFPDFLTSQLNPSQQLCTTYLLTHSHQWNGKRESKA